MPATEHRQLLDKFNRRINYLRISITDRCNLRCKYCIPKISIPKLSHDDILTYEELLRIVEIGADLGITKVRITGGEPLVRKGVYSFLDKISKIKEINDISITTNAVLLEQNLERLRNAGISRLNISLDTLDRAKYKQITGFDCFERVWGAIQKAVSMGFHPIKLNTVAMRGINDDEFEALSRLTFDYPVDVRFIEYMPIGESRLDSTHHILSDEIMSIISKRLGSPDPVEGITSGPARRFRFKDAIGEIGLISPVSHTFCSSCNRIRLTSTGRLRPCLLEDKSIDIATALRQGASDKILEEIFIESILQKRIGHQLETPDKEDVRSLMSSIGG